MQKIFLVTKMRVSNLGLSFFETDRRRSHASIATVKLIFLEGKNGINTFLIFFIIYFIEICISCCFTQYKVEEEVVPLFLL